MYQNKNYNAKNILESRPLVLVLVVHLLFNLQNKINSITTHKSQPYRYKINQYCFLKIDVTLWLSSGIIKVLS